MKKKKKKNLGGFYTDKIIIVVCLLILLLAGIKLYGKNSISNKQETYHINTKVYAATVSTSFRVPIFMYHYVEYVEDKNDTIRMSLGITPDVFEAQIKTLKTAGYTFITVSDLGDVLNGKKELPQNAVVFTFDDGYRDLYTDVFPILQKYKVMVTAYIVAGFLDKPNYLLTTQLEEIVQSGLVEIGAHSVSHVSLKGVLLHDSELEIIESKKQLEQLLNIQVFSFAYPYGLFDEQAVEVVKKAGFTTAVSTLPGIVIDQDNRYFAFRLRPGRRTGEDLLNYLKQDSFGEYQ